MSNFYRTSILLLLTSVLLMPIGYFAGLEGLFVNGASMTFCWGVAVAAQYLYKRSMQNPAFGRRCMTGICVLGVLVLMAYCAVLMFNSRLLVLQFSPRELMIVAVLLFVVLMSLGLYWFVLKTKLDKIQS